jgi:hypothetical protein
MSARRITNYIPWPSTQHKEDSQGQDPVHGRRCSQKTTSMSRDLDGEEWTPHLDQVRFVCNHCLHHHRRRIVAVGIEGDRRHLQAISLDGQGGLYS